jgi:hypothetical protein
LIQHQQQQHHNTKAGASSTSALGWKSSARSLHLNNINTKLEIFTRSWHLNNISTKLEIFNTKLASQQHQHEAGNLQHEAGITTTSTQSWKYSALASQQHQHEAGNLQHEVGITTTSARSWKFSARGWHHNNINTKLEIFSTRLASPLLPLSREVLSDYTKLISKVLKIYTIQRLGQNICNMFICANIMDLYGSSLHHITNVMISYFYVF